MIEYNIQSYLKQFKLTVCSWLNNLKPCRIWYGSYRSKSWINIHHTNKIRGDLVFDDHHLVSKVLGQRVSLTCESPVEKAYYNDKGRALKLPDICIHCAEGGSTDFLFGQTELEERGKTGGRQCYPICTLCLNAGKTVATYPKKKTNYTKNRKEGASKKAAVEVANKSKAKKKS